MITVNPTYQQQFNQFDSFGDYFKLEGEVFKRIANRCTLKFQHAGQSYFVKQHAGVGWFEIIKNLVRLRLPIVSAKTEWQAIQRLHELGVATMQPVAYGVTGCSPAQLQSFLVTKDLGATISLEKLSQAWQHRPPSFALKQALLVQVATIARQLHGNGVNHRDFYLCHLLLDVSQGMPQPDPSQLTLYVIDLHRAQCRKQVPQRWQVKDLAALYFSSMNIGLTKRDLLRFIKNYTQQSLRQGFLNERYFWCKVEKRALRMYRKQGV